MIVSKLRFPTQLIGTYEHGLCPKLDRTLERSRQHIGVEDSASLPVRFFRHMKSGQIVDGIVGRQAALVID